MLIVNLRLQLTIKISINMKAALSILYVMISISAIGQVDSSFDLYLLIGQSNMAGRGVVTEKYAVESYSNVLMLDKENHWVQAKHPLHFDKPAVAGVGPGLSFGIEMAKKDPSHKIGLIPCAVGGSSINAWEPGAYDSATKTHPYDDMLKRVQIAQRSGVIKGVLWLQGESDSNPQRSVGYIEKFEKLINRLRQTVSDPGLPVVPGELGTFKQQYQDFNKMVLDKVPTSISHTAVASSKGLKDKGDKTHFDSASAEKYGKRFAKKMQLLQRRKLKT